MAVLLDTPRTLVMRTFGEDDLPQNLTRLEAFVAGRESLPLSRHPAWLSVLADGLQHRPFCLEAVEGEKTRGILPLAHVSGLLFGSFLVSLPYLNYGGVLADDEGVARRLIDQAVELAERLDVRYLELRHERPVDHPSLGHRMQNKVHMRLPLPNGSEQLWSQLSGKVRNQVRKGEKSGLSVHWGQQDLLAEFYEVFTRNMRDLGTPVYGRGLFLSVLRHFPRQAELCVVRAENRAVAAALLLHGWGVTEVPSASSLRETNSTCANMLMYWHLLKRAIERGQKCFDFGRSTPDSNTFQFKKQWGATPSPATWQFHLRRGELGDMRPDHPKHQRRIRLWRRLPVHVTRWLGPAIVRGIP